MVRNWRSRVLRTARVRFSNVPQQLGESGVATSLRTDLREELAALRRMLDSRVAALESLLSRASDSATLDMHATPYPPTPPPRATAAAQEGGPSSLQRPG